MDRAEIVARRIRLKDLLTLQAVATAGSMAKASSQLALSQPAISKAIAEMEDVLKTSLFERSSSGVALTDSGRMLVERARVIFDELRHGVADIDSFADPSKGTVRIGTTEPMVGVIAEIIKQLPPNQRQVSHEVLVSDTETLARELRDRNLDVLLTRWIAPLVADDLAADVLFESPLIVVADRRHRLVGKKKQSLAELMGEAWTLSPSTSFLGRIVGDLFSRHGLSLPSALVTSVSIYMRLNLIAGGRFISILPDAMLRHPTNLNWLRPLNVDLRDSSSPIAMIALKGRRCSGAVQFFMRFAKQICQNLAEPH